MSSKRSSIWVFEKCCLCIELRTGCLIIAYLKLISEIIIATVSFLGIAAAAILMSSSDPQEWSAGLVVLILSAILLLFVVVLMAFTVVLLVGLHKNRPGHVKLFLIYSLVFLVLYVILSITEIAITAISPLIIVMKIVFILFDIYLLLVIRSYWLKIDSGKDIRKDHLAA